MLIVMIRKIQRPNSQKDAWGICTQGEYTHSSLNTLSDAMLFYVNTMC